MFSKSAVIVAGVLTLSLLSVQCVDVPSTGPEIPDDLKASASLNKAEDANVQEGAAVAETNQPSSEEAAATNEQSSNKKVVD